MGYTINAEREATDDHYSSLSQLSRELGGHLLAIWCDTPAAYNGYFWPVEPAAWVGTNIEKLLRR